jgi:hypothetical protein
MLRPQVRPAHVGSRDPDDGTRRLHDRWRGALFEADVARTVKNRVDWVRPGPIPAFANVTAMSVAKSKKIAALELTPRLS